MFSHQRKTRKHVSYLKTRNTFKGSFMHNYFCKSKFLFISKYKLLNTFIYDYLILFKIQIISNSITTKVTVRNYELNINWWSLAPRDRMVEYAYKDYGPSMKCIDCWVPTTKQRSWTHRKSWNTKSIGFISQAYS